jgi:site-specific recombinase XerD
MLSLTPANMDLFRKTITVKGKGDKLRTFPPNAVALDILKTRMKARHISSNLIFPSENGSKMTKIMRRRLVRAFSKAANEAGLQDFHFHDLRHTFATRLAQAGVDIYRIAKLLCHNDESRTQRYAHHCPESLHSGVDILSEYHASLQCGQMPRGMQSMLRRNLLIFQEEKWCPLHDSNMRPQV